MLSACVKEEALELSQVIINKLGGTQRMVCSVCVSRMCTFMCCTCVYVLFTASLSAGGNSKVGDLNPDSSPFKQFLEYSVTFRIARSTVKLTLVDVIILGIEVAYYVLIILPRPRPARPSRCNIINRARAYG